jgi:outer membrane protein assembly factor BamE (lipoprotein component of BamABCDE complex)
LNRTASVAKANKSPVRAVQDRRGVKRGPDMAATSAWIRWSVAAVLALSLGACTANYRTHGYLPPPEQLSEIVVGLDTRASVEDTVGPPSSSGILQDSGYYYVRSRIRSFAYFEPEVVEREVLAISFDANGVVSNIERFGLEDGRIVTLERRVTESSVVDRTFIRQLLGGLGRLTPSL